MREIKNTTNIFKRYRNPFLPLRVRFLYPDKKSNKIQNIIQDRQENNSFINLLRYINATRFSKIAYLENNIVGLLDRFTDDNISDEEVDEVKNKIIRDFYEITDIFYSDRNTINIHLKDRSIIVNRMSFIYPKIAEYHPDILTTDTRVGKCHLMAMTIARGLSEEAVIATGSMFTVTPRAKYLHSWIEEEINNETYCHDFTANISLKKEDYYNLFHIEPYEKITAKQFKEDQPSLLKLVVKNPIYTKLYLSSRDEAINIASKLPDIDLSNYSLDLSEK